MISTDKVWRVNSCFIHFTCEWKSKRATTSVHWKQRGKARCKENTRAAMRKSYREEREKGIIWFMGSVERVWKISVFKLHNTVELSSRGIFSYNFIGKGGWNWFVVKVDFSLYSLFFLELRYPISHPLFFVSRWKYDTHEKSERKISNRYWAIPMKSGKVLCRGAEEAKKKLYWKFTRKSRTCNRTWCWRATWVIVIRPIAIYFQQ